MTDFENFINNDNFDQYKTEKIGDPHKMTFDNGIMSTFNKVIQTVGKINMELALGLQMSKNNINYLVNLLVEINDIGKVELSNITKDLSNKIVYIYDNLVTCINKQRSENLKLEIELANAIREKNQIKEELELLTNSISQLEVSLGVQKDRAFETMHLLSKK